MCKARDAAIYVANRVLEFKNSENNNEYNVDFYKTHKLLYYAQGFMMALYDKTIFSENIRLHTCGSYIDGMDGFYEMVGSEEIEYKIPEAVPLTIDRRKILKYVAKKYGKCSRNEFINSTKNAVMKLTNAAMLKAENKPIIPRDIILKHLETELNIGNNAAKEQLRKEIEQENV